MKVLSKITVCLCLLLGGQTLSAYYYHSGYYNRETSWIDTQSRDSSDYEDECGYQSYWYQGSLNPLILLLATDTDTQNSTFGKQGQSTGEPLSGSDNAVSERVRKALSASSTPAARKISATVQNGRVTLTGDVNSTSEKSAAATAVRKVKGVTSVDNKITIKTK